MTLHLCLQQFPNVPITTIHSPTPCPPSVHGKTVFHATSPSCLKGWGLLLYSRHKPIVTPLPLTPCPSVTAPDLEEPSVSMGPSEANPDTGTRKQHSPMSRMWSEHPQHQGLAINPSPVEGQTGAALQRSANFIQVLDGCGPKTPSTLTMSGGRAMGSGGSRGQLVNGRAVIDCWPLTRREY